MGGRGNCTTGYFVVGNSLTDPLDNGSPRQYPYVMVAIIGQKTVIDLLKSMSKCFDILKV